SSGSHNSENIENLKATSYKSDEEKTSTNQDEDIKVTSHNSDKVNTSFEDENIDIPDPMDIEPTDPYGKRKIDSDIQIDDYLRSYNKDFEKVENTTRIFGNKTKNIATNDVKHEYPREISNQPIQQRIDNLNKRNVAQGGIYLDLSNIPISDHEKNHR
ncbi:hypothetical protein Goklo_023964, partial [Gossypium klotzschianum]|nr:hypothetical protein [Gossypium klotzschianum]